LRNSSRTWLLRENRAFASKLAAGALVLDAGAGDQPYREFFGHCRYESADFQLVDKPYAKSTYVCDLARIPVENERFDAVVFNQVMEHLPDPLRVLHELNRIMKPQGVMICTAPLFYEEHEKPYDFYRYTQFAWRHLLERAGFRIERLDWVEGYFGTLGYQLSCAARFLPVKPGDVIPGVLGFLALPLVLVMKGGFRILAEICQRIDERHRSTARGFPKNYLVIARKAPGG
jgi:SAM-dependent methyltransferase